MTAPPLTFWVLDGELLAGKYPGPRKAEADFIDALTDVGVRTFIDLTEPDEGPLLPYEHLLLEDAVYARFAVPDVTCPSREQVAAAIRTIDEGRGRGVVYVHCRGGCGRTGVVVGAYLVHRGMEPARALERVHELTRDLWNKSCPETDEQIEMVLRWS